MLEFFKRLLGSSPPESKTVAPQPMQTSNRAPAPLAAAMNRFALELWRSLPANENALLSPASLWLALAMTATGARGQTKAELDRVLRLHEVLDDKVLQKLKDWNVEAGDAATLRVVNRLFGDQTTPFEADWRSMIADTWLGGFEALSFRDGAEAARTHINDWVALQTAERIRDLLPTGSITGDTRLVLVNAVYFLAKWQSAFNERLTAPAQFFGPGGERNVPTMRNLVKVPFVELEHARVACLPYQDGPLELVIVLPRAREGLAAVEAALTPDSLEGWMDARTLTRLNLWLPKFKLEPKGSMALKAQLQAMGVSLAFERRKADFSAMANPPNEDDRLSISEVFHQAFLEVDETGTEAAAATAVVMTRAGSAPAVEQPPVDFIVEHPFLVILRDTETGEWMFFGRVVEP